MLASACVEVESAFKVPADYSVNVYGLVFSFKLILGFKELFSILLTTSTMNERLSLKASSKMRLVTPSISLKVL